MSTEDIIEKRLHELSDKIVSHWWNQQQPFEESLIQAQIRYRKIITEILLEDMPVLCCHCGDEIEVPLCRSCEIHITLPDEEY